MAKYTPERFLELVCKELETVSLNDAEPARKIALAWADVFGLDTIDTIKLGKDFVAFARVYHKWKSNQL